MNGQKLKSLLVGEASSRRFVRSSILVTAFIYISFVIFAYLCSDGIIFQPQKASYNDGPHIIKVKTGNGGVHLSIIPPKSRSHVYIPVQSR